MRKSKAKDTGRKKGRESKRKKDTEMLLIVSKSSLFGYKPYRYVCFVLLLYAFSMFAFPEREQYTAVLHVFLTSLVEQISFSIYMNKSQKL